MQDNGTPPDRKERPAYPLRGYSLMDFKTDPGITGIVFETEAGPFMFVANKEIMAMLGAAFTHKSESMPASQPV